MIDSYALNSLGKIYKQNGLLDSYGIGIYISDQTNKKSVKDSYNYILEYKYAFIDQYDAVMRKALSRAWPLLDIGAQSWEEEDPKIQEKIVDSVKRRNRLVREDLPLLGPYNYLVAGEPINILPILTPDLYTAPNQRWIKPHGPNRRPNGWLWPINLGNINKRFYHKMSFMVISN